MRDFTLFVGAIYGLLAVVIGALAAHGFKKIVAEDKIKMIQVGVRYQMYAAFYLLLVGWNMDFSTLTERLIPFLMIVGTFLFVVTVYLKAFEKAWNVSLKPIKFVTPLGGVLILVSWLLLAIHFLQY